MKRIRRKLDGKTWMKKGKKEGRDKERKPVSREERKARKEGRERASRSSLEK